jgi:hypothetical protein
MGEWHPQYGTLPNFHLIFYQAPLNDDTSVGNRAS